MSRAHAAHMKHARSTHAAHSEHTRSTLEITVHSRKPSKIIKRLKFFIAQVYSNFQCAPCVLRACCVRAACVLRVCGVRAPHIHVKQRANYLSGPTFSGLSHTGAPPVTPLGKHWSANYQASANPFYNQWGRSLSRALQMISAWPACRQTYQSSEAHGSETGLKRKFRTPVWARIKGLYDRPPWSILDCLGRRGWKQKSASKEANM